MPNPASSPVKPPADIIMKSIPYLNTSSLSLTVFTNKESTDQNLLVFIHGGAWISNSTADFHDFAISLAKQGLQVVLVSYRLTKKNEVDTMHPRHLRDVQDGLSTLFSTTLVTGSITLCGHSCGAYLAQLALLQLQKSRLKKVKQFVGIEGIYDIAALSRVWPDYRKWFLDDVFGAGNNGDDIVGTEKFPKSLKYIVIYSNQDELIDAGQGSILMAWLLRSGNSARYIDGDWGKHDDILKNDVFLEILGKIVKS